MTDDLGSVIVDQLIDSENGKCTLGIQNRIHLQLQFVIAGPRLKIRVFVFAQEDLQCAKLFCSLKLLQLSYLAHRSKYFFHRISYTCIR
jgi:hypothetical protein